MIWFQKILNILFYPLVCKKMFPSEKALWHLSRTQIVLIKRYFSFDMFLRFNWMQLSLNMNYNLQFLPFIILWLLRICMFFSTYLICHFYKYCWTSHNHFTAAIKYIWCDFKDLTIPYFYELFRYWICSHFTICPENSGYSSTYLIHFAIFIHE